MRRMFSLLSLVVGLLAPVAAAAEGKSIIVLDGSGSMWGQIDGRTKLEIAREALATVLQGIPADTEIGLMAYGHREKGNCGDIELIVPPGPGTAAAIIDAANKMQFLGKTPLSEAVRRAAAELKSTEEKATVILITDGIETCDADPCALGTELEASGVDFTAHVVGFGLTKEEGKAVACLAENTGGKYIDAKNAGTLVDALKAAVEEAVPEPAPPPEPPPPPKPAALEKNFDPMVVLTEGQPEPERKLIESAVFALRLINPDGSLSEEQRTVYGNGTELIAPGTYRMVTELHKARVEQDVTIAADTLAQPVAVLNAGVLNLRVFAYEGGEVEDNAFWEMRGPNDITALGYGHAFLAFPAGDYTLTTSYGAAKLEQTVAIEAGQTVNKDVVMGTGLAVVDASYTEGMLLEGADQFVEIYEAKKDIEGNRKSVGYTYGEGAKFNLPGGEYVAKVSVGGTVVEVPFSVRAGERTDVLAPLNAGVAAFTSPSDAYIEVLGAKTDINGNRKSFDHSYGPTWKTTLPAGDYIVTLSLGDQKTETPMTVTAGERTELTLTLP